MKYVSIDIETTGLNPETCQVIQIGAVLDDFSKPLREAPCFEILVRHKVYQGEPYALSMHPKIMRALADGEGVPAKAASDRLWTWLRGNNILDGFVVAGKNYGGFDKRFLEKLPLWNHFIRPHHASLDPGSLYFDPSVDTTVPSTGVCLQRAGLRGTVAHTALADAWDVCRLLRYKLLGHVE